MKEDLLARVTGSAAPRPEKEILPARGKAAAKAALAALVAEGRLFLWPPRTGKIPLYGVTAPESEASLRGDQALATLRASTVPLSLEALAAAIGWPDDTSPAPLAAWLAPHLHDGTVFAWPGRKKGEIRYGSASPETVLERALRDSLHGQALPRAEVVKLAAAGGSGIPKPVIPGLIADWIARGKLLELPAGKRKLVFDPTHPEGYWKTFLPALRPLLDAMFAPGLDTAAGKAFLDAELDRYGNEPPEADRLLTALRDLEPVAGVPVAAARLRERVPGPIDAAVLALSDTGQVALSRHDDPYNQTAAERGAMITDGKGNYYVAVAWRHG